MNILLIWAVALSMLMSYVGLSEGQPKVPPLKEGVTSLKEPPHSDPHGPVWDGLSLGIWSEKDRYVINTRMNVWIILLSNSRKDSDGRIIPYDEKIFEDSYLMITLPNGQVIKEREHAPLTGMPGMGFKGGISDRLHKVIREPGIYKLKWWIGKMESNDLTLTVVDEK